eukprot:sb/3463712/
MVDSKAETQRCFQFTYEVPKSKSVFVEIPVYFPISGLPTDHAEVHIKDYRIPCFAEDAFRLEFLSFVTEQQDQLIQEEGDLLVADIAEALEDSVEVWQSYGKCDPPPSVDILKIEEEFGKICYELYHSPLLPALRARENKAASELRDLVKQRNDELKRIQEHHVLSMEEYVNRSNVESTAVNDLAASQMEQRQNCEIEWASKISHLMDSQRSAFKTWIMDSYQESLGGEEITSHGIPVTDSYSPPQTSGPVLEESFSISIGSQLKITHSLRLLADNIWSLCVGHPASPERLQTALSLYTNSLAGVMLLVDNRLNLYSGATQKLSKICELVPEFHFPPFDAQLTEVRQKLLDPGTERRRTPTNYLIDDTLPDAVIREDVSSGDMILPTGTCYVTRHSNLRQVHVVFHLVSTAHEVSGDIASRDLLLVGLKNALKLASENNIDTITIPIFLTHELDPTMDHGWCVKRAEVVLKCVKGFMIEVGSTGTITSRTFQFIMPKKTPERTFHSISSLIPNIFRVPCPMVLDQTSRKKTLNIEEL